MKTETEIAKENLRQDQTLDRFFSKQHKETCQRWLGFLLDWENKCEEKRCGFCSPCNEKWLNKQKDLQNAIKLYEEEGI